jgi:hypothetical protein
MYRGVPFQVLTDKEIASQIAQAAAYNRDGVRRIFLGGWRCHGFGSTALDYASLILYIKFSPHLQRVSSYAAPKDILAKTAEEMLALKAAGLKATLLRYGKRRFTNIKRY